MGKLSKSAAMAVAICCPAASAAQPAAPSAAVEEIVVTARRTGIPVWRVSGPRTTIVLIGSIDNVARDTRWDPGALTATLRKADRVMFPNIIGLTATPFAMIGYLMKWRKQATLPKGQTLASFMRPEQFQRLVALKNRGILKAGFERKHPLHLSMTLEDLAAGRRGYGPDAVDHVEKAVRKHKIRTVPIATVRAKSVAKDFFALPPQTYVPCLLASVGMIEAGPGAVKARSDAWAERRVPDVLQSPVQKASEVCSPKSWDLVPQPDLRPQIRRLMADPQLTVAVVNLDALARPGGVLDDLNGAGFAIQGPRWR